MSNCIYRLLSSQRLLVILLFLLSVNASFAATKAATQKEAAKPEQVPAQAQAVEARPEPVRRKAAEELRSKALAEQLHDGSDLRWLKADDNEFLALYRPYLASESRGVILMLPGNTEHPNWPGIFAQLRTQLPREGWATFAIAMPDYLPQSKSVPHAAEQSMPSADAGATQESNSVAKKASEDNQQPPAPSESATFISPDPAAEQLPELSLKRISTALQQLDQSAGSKVFVVAVGVGATWLLHAVKTTPSLRVAGLVMLNAGARQAEIKDFDFDVAVTDLSIPVLDVQTEGFDDVGSQRRKLLAIKNGRSLYRQIIMPSAATGFMGVEDELYKRILGWLKTSTGG